MRISVAREMLLFIEENVEVGVSINDLIRFSGYSRRAIHGIFDEFVGVSAGAYIRGRRLCKAAVMLRLTSISCTQIAVDSGFSCHQSFSREFRRYFGVSPREYRSSEVWDLSQLVPSVRLGAKSLIQTRSELVSLSSMFLDGHAICFKGYLPCQERERRRRIEWQNIISDNLSRNKEDTFFISEVRVVPGGVGWFMVDTFIGVLRKVAGVCSRTKEFPGGLYLKYSFSGTPVEYSTLSIDIATGLLPILGLKRRRGADIECFKYSGGEVSDTGVVCCDYYMPVSH